MSALDGPHSSAVGHASALSLELLLRNLPGAAYRCLNDGDWTMEFVSDGIERLTGYPATAFMARPGLHYADIIFPEDRYAVQRNIAAALDEGSEFQLTYRIRCANGELKWVYEQGAAAPLSRGQMLVGLLFDFTRVRNADMLVHEQASYLQRALEQLYLSGAMLEKYRS